MNERMKWRQSGAISSASSGHVMELKKKYFGTVQESAISLIVDYMWLILTFWEDSQVLISPFDFAKSPSPLIYCLLILLGWSEGLNCSLSYCQPSSWYSEGLEYLFVQLGWIGLAGIEESEAIGRDLRASSHHPDPFPSPQGWQCSHLSHVHFH